MMREKYLRSATAHIGDVEKIWKNKELKMTVTFNDQKYKIWFISVTIDQIKIKFAFAIIVTIFQRLKRRKARYFGSIWMKLKWFL